LAQIQDSRVAAYAAARLFAFGSGGKRVSISIVGKEVVETSSANRK
jgi:hypothetical protein